ncbi:MAG: phosphoribosylformylglycinamidine synthase subunit PurL [Firmicutes bacterium]|nr:phosphoribosylformylglycinamidine synthase subunit PurL [Bacillota bacterium]
MARAAEAGEATQVAGLLPGDLGRIRAGLGRAPSETELSLFSAMWSEHCAYRHSRPLLGRLPTRGEAVAQGPGENAGIVDLGGGLGLACKVESHNHPSAVEPHQGAATGVGGILRDVLSLGARPVALLDGLGFGPAEDAKAAWLARGVVEGVGAYGNAVGVPTVGGVTRYLPGYAHHPLLNAMCAGLVALDRVVYGRARRAGDVLLLLGATTGRDGVGGASFASEDLDADRTARRPQVQVGDPFAEKRLIEATLEAMAAGLVQGCQDMGAAGIVSSTSELCHRAGLGCEVDLDRVPLRQPGMAGWEILLSESQERMLLDVDPADVEAVAAIARHWSLEAAAIGRVLAEPVYRARRGGEVVADLPMALLCEPPAASLAPGPRPRRAAPPPPPPAPGEWGDVAVAVLTHPDVADKAEVYERYDSTVQAHTALGPPSGAAVLTLPGRSDGVALTLDMNPAYALADPHAAAALTVVEGVQNLASVGAEPLALTDCLNLGDPTTAAGAAELVASVDGLAEACRALGVPVVGGNVSLYNEGPAGRMPPTVAVGMVGRVPRVEGRPARGLIRAGEVLLLVGPREGEVGGSVYARVRAGDEGAGAPALPDYAAVARAAAFVRDARRRGLARYACDVWTGGLLAAVWRAAAAGGRGAEIDLEPMPADRLAAVLFGEGAGRYLVAASPTRARRLRERAAAAGLELHPLGSVRSAPGLAVRVGARLLFDVTAGRRSRRGEGRRR